MSRALAVTLLVLGLFTTSARAQFGYFYRGGATIAGDYLTGVGIAAAGMGSYNLNTAMANSINVDTEIKWNEYVYACIKNEMRENAEHRAAMMARDHENYNKIQQRIRENPEERDVENGDSLNAVLDQLLSPKIQESSFRYAEVPLAVDAIRLIPFKLGEKNEKFSMTRLSPRGKGKWPVAFQDDRFAAERRGYERALDTALEQAIDGKMSQEALREVEVAVERLKHKLDKVIPPSNDRQYIEAKKRLDELSISARLLKTHKIEMVLGEIDKYGGTTVNDLRIFMQRYNLRFAVAESPDERKLYPELYATLVQQRDKLVGAIEPPPAK
jgi:hypothetical protein